MIERNASFSHAISTSPIPRCTNVVVDPRAPESSTGTFLYSGFTKSLRLVVVPARLLERVSPGAQIIPARAAGGLGIGRDHRNAGLHQIVPILDVFGIALSHQEHDRRGVGSAVLRQPLLPVGRKQAGVLGNSVDVVGQRQGYDIGLQTVNHRAGLLARSTVGLLDRDCLAGLRLPVFGESLVEILIQLARRIVGNIQQSGRTAPRPVKN